MNRRSFLTCLAASAAAAQTRATLASAELLDIDRAVTSEMARTGAPGLSLAIVMDGEVRYANGYGLADLENTVPATAETVYRLGSIAKPITAIAVMQLVEKGRISLDAPIQRYVPGFPEKPWPVTVRQLLGHLGGVRHYQGQEILSTRHYSDVLAPLDIFKDDPLLHEPGTKYSYTTYGFNLLGAAVEQASGERFVGYLQRHIFDPAGMDRMREDSVYAIIPHRAQGYAKRSDGSLQNGALADTSNKIPGGGLCSTVYDLALLAIAIFDDKLVGPAAREQMFTSQKTLDGKRTGYGYGWAIDTQDGFHFVQHGGGQPRISTMLAMIPDRRFAVAWMCNLENSGLRLHRDLPRLLLK